MYPIEMIAAYSAFATLGTQARAMGIVRVENAAGEVLWAPESVRVPVMSAEESWLIVDMLKDVVRRGTAAASVGAQFSIPSGGKTGTTNDYTDVWYIGFTSDLVAGVWMGLDKPEKIMTNAQGGRLAAPAWTAFMTEVYRRKPAPPDWPRPIGIITKSVDLLSNTQWAPDCPGVQATEVFIAGTEPTIPCNLMPGLWPDTSGFGGTPLSPTNPRDTMLMNTTPGGVAGRIMPGAASAPRASVPRDTFVIQRSPPAGTRPLPPNTPSRDTTRTRVDSVKSGGVIIRRDTLTS